MALDVFMMDYRFIHERLQAIVDRFDEQLAFARPTPDMNHAAWLVGHLTWCEDFLVADIPYGRTFRKKEWDSMFDYNSKKLAREAYPSYWDIRDHYSHVHQHVARVVDDAVEDGLKELVPYQGRQFSRLSFVIHYIEEGGTHVGQLQYLLKFLEANRQGANNRVSGGLAAPGGD